MGRESSEALSRAGEEGAALSRAAKAEPRLKPRAHHDHEPDRVQHRQMLAQEAAPHLGAGEGLWRHEFCFAQTLLYSSSFSRVTAPQICWSNLRWSERRIT
jgi:hypothetical protein